MASITSSSAPGIAEHRDGPSGLLNEVRIFWRQFIVAAFNAYRPELHYMRGPGPAWREKNANQVQL